jgi:Fe2+ transport system protein B
VLIVPSVVIIWVRVVLLSSKIVVCKEAVVLEQDTMNRRTNSKKAFGLIILMFGCWVGLVMLTKAIDRRSGRNVVACVQ